MSFLREDYPGAARPQAAAWREPSPPQAWPEQPWAGPGEDPADYDPRYAEPRYADPGYYEPGYADLRYAEPGYYEPGYAEPGYDKPGYYEAGRGGEAYQPDEYYQDPAYQDPAYQDPAYYPDPRDAYQAPPDEGDDFPGPAEPDAYLDAMAGADAGAGIAAGIDLQPPPATRPRVRRYRGGRRNRRGGRGGAGSKRVAGIVVAAASVVGVALLAPSILTAAENETLTGVVTQSSLASLNFAATGRVLLVRVRLGQMVRKGQLLAREVTPAGALSALGTDRSAIVADKADLAAIVAAGAPPASVTAARAQLATDRAKRVADQAAMVIRAPMAGTVAAVFGRAGDQATPAGLAGPAQPPAATQLSALTLASLRGGGRELPVIALRTLSSVQVKLLIPAQSPAALNVGSALTLSVPAARLARVRGVITALTAGPASTGGGHLAVIQLSGNPAAAALTGMRASVYLSS